MKPFFSRNIDDNGRLVRGLGALALLVGAGFGFALSVWLGIALLAAGVFVAFEALRGLAASSSSSRCFGDSALLLLLMLFMVLTAASAVRGA